MIYFKLIKTHVKKAEDDFNSFFKEVYEIEHHILHTQYRLDEDGNIFGLFTVSDRKRKDV